MGRLEGMTYVFSEERSKSSFFCPAKPQQNLHEKVHACAALFFRVLMPHAKRFGVVETSLKFASILLAYVFCKSGCIQHRPGNFGRVQAGRATMSDGTLFGSSFRLSARLKDHE